MITSHCVIMIRFWTLMERQIFPWLLAAWSSSGPKWRELRQAHIRRHPTSVSVSDWNGRMAHLKKKFKNGVICRKSCMRLQDEGKAVRESSLEVGFFWEGATCSSDDDVGCIVGCLHALIQWFLLDQSRQETWSTEEQLEQECTENKGQTTQNLETYQMKNTGKSYLLQRRHLHRSCQQCPWGRSSVRGMSQPCHLYRHSKKIVTSIAHL